jgi:threonine/homoserine/homoserine lactone efflux protein
MSDKLDLLRGIVLGLRFLKKKTMNRITKLFLWTLLVSFLGSLPIGTLNVSITNLALHQSSSSAFLFGAGAILIELLLVRVAIQGMVQLEKATGFLVVFHWAAVVLLLAFATFSIVAALEMKTFGTSPLFVGGNPFAAGLLLSALNPLHLPFWLGWTAAFKSKGMMHSSHHEYNIYVLAIGLGTTAAFVLYAWAGRALVLLLADKQFLINWAVGLTVFATAFLQVQKILQKRQKSIG